MQGQQSEEEEHIEEIASRFEDVKQVVEVKKFKFAYILLSYFGISILVVFCIFVYCDVSVSKRTH